MDAKIEEKIDKLGEKLCIEVFADLKHAMDHFNADVGAIKQLLPVMVAAKSGLTSPSVVELDAAEELAKQLGVC